MGEAHGGSQVVVPESVTLILRLLARAARRSVWLAFARGTVLAVTTLASGLSIVTLAVNEGARSAAIVTLGLTLLVAMALALWRLRGVRSRLAIRAQAEVVEGLRPELRGALLTVVDRTSRPLGSAGLMARLADEVAGRVRGLRPADIWPGRPLWDDARWGVLAALGLVFIALRAPLGPIDAFSVLFGAPSANASVAAVAAGGPHAVLGDITLRYEYPTYTRLEPLEVPNTSGEVHAPPGTVVQIRARTAQPWESATLEVSGSEPVAATLVEGRTVSGHFTVGEEGTWRFRFGELPTAEYRISPDPDLAPVIAIQAEAATTVNVDTPVSFGFNAKDDYGITKVVVELTVKGKVTELPLRVPLDSPRTLADQPTLSATELGLKVGDSAKVRVGAWDNDEVSGSKVGWSSVFTIEVAGAAGSQAARQQLRQRLYDALIPLLADFVMDPQPPAPTGEGLARWSVAADERYTAFDVASSGAEGLDRHQFEPRIVDNVNGARRDLLAFLRGLPPGALGAKDAETLSTLQLANVRALEMAVWTLDQAARAEALRALDELVKQLAAEAKELRDELSNLTPAQALARLDQLARLERQVKAAAAKLDRGSVRAFLDSRGAELDGAIAAARRDITAKDDPAAKADMQRVADLLDEMAGGVEETQKRSSGDGEELKKEIEALKSELGDLAKDEGELQKKTDAARDQHGQSLEKGLEAWKAVDAASKAAKGALDDPALQKGKENHPYASAAEDAKHDAGGLDDSVRARDTETSLERAKDLQQSLSRARTRLQQAARGGQMAPNDAAKADAALGRAQRSAAEAQAKLEELAAAQSEASPELAEALQQLSGEQRQLADRAGKTAARAQKVARSLPSDASELEKAAGEGAEQAKRAGEAMGEGDAMGASGGQQAAKDAFERAQDALEQALQDAQQMQSGEGSGQGDEEKEGQAGGEKGGNGGQSAKEVTIPAPEEFETPEAYRKALLEGMQGEVPEAYRAANRRYYEELVRQ